MTEQEKLLEKDKQRRREWNRLGKIGVTAFLTFASCILFFFFIFRYDQFSAGVNMVLKAGEPIIIGLVLAYLLLPTKEFIENLAKEYLENFVGMKEEAAQKAGATVGIAGALVFLFVIIAVFIAIFVPALGSSIIGLVDAMPDYIDSFVLWIQESRLGDDKAAYYVGELLTTATVAIEEWAQTELLPIAQEYIGQITSGVLSLFKTLLNFIIGIIVACYVMAINKTLIGQCKKIIYAFFPAKRGNRIIETARKSNEIFSGFIIGKIIDSAIIGVMAYIGCLILRMPSALLVAVIIGVTNVIPFFGPFIGAVPSIILVLIQSPIHAVYLAIFILILQQVDGNIIGPKILGDTTGLSSFWVLFSILVAGGVFGFLGMLLGVPVFAVIYYILQETINHRMEKRKLPKETQKYIELESITSENELIYGVCDETAAAEKENDSIKK
uniref:AI-2E family transporter n=1 Tax=Agathobacter sp. TaxID=2021311 RepID=UPI0040574564